MKKSLLTLTLGGFGIGMTEFVTMGILPDIATGLNITVPQVGHLISAYALGVVVGAPLLVAFAGHYPPRRILMALMLVFTVFNGLSALMPNYELLLLARFLSGLPHGAFFGVGAVVAGRLAGPGREAGAIAMMFAGLTVANLIGVPLGTYIGHETSWRLTYGLISGIGIVTILALLRWMPALPSVTAAVNLRDTARMFTKGRLWLSLGIAAIGTGGLFTWYSYVAKLITEVAGFDKSSIQWVLIVAGSGMFVGNLLGGRLADRFSPLKTTAVLLAVTALTLIVVALTAHWKIPMLAMTFVTGMVTFALAAPVQMLMLGASEGSEMIASSLGQAGFNIGNALGAFLGGLPLAMGYGFTSPEWVGAGMAASGVLLSLALLKLYGTPVRLDAGGRPMKVVAH